MPFAPAPRNLASRSGWLPILDDPDDEPLVQLAYDSDARRIVTHNIRHLSPARVLNIEVLPPRDFAAMISTAMKLQIDIPDEHCCPKLRELASREHVSMDHLLSPARLRRNSTNLRNAPPSPNAPRRVD